jgi:hypothetical protein
MVQRILDGFVDFVAGRRFRRIVRLINDQCCRLVVCTRRDQRAERIADLSGGAIFN